MFIKETLKFFDLNPKPMVDQSRFLLGSSDPFITDIRQNSQHSKNKKKYFSKKGL